MKNDNSIGEFALNLIKVTAIIIITLVTFYYITI